MILHVFDEDFTYRGRIENWIDLSWSEEFRGEGAFTLAVYDTDQYAELLREGRSIYRADRLSAMLIVRIERDTDANTISVYGYSALHLLSRRIVNGKKSVTNVESGVYALINDYKRGLNQIATAAPKGLTAENECEIEGVEVLEGVTTILEGSDYGVRAVFDRENLRHVVEVYEGVDRSYSAESGGTLFCQEFGGLRSLKVTEDDDFFKNVAYVTGAANNDPSIVYYQYMDAETAAGPQSAWRELVVEGEDQQEGESNPDWRKRQKQIAIEALAERKNALTFEIELAPGTFGKKYDLGDVVTCKSKRYGLQFDTRIMEYQYSYRSGKETEKIVIGERPVSYVRSEILRRKR